VGAVSLKQVLSPKFFSFPLPIVILPLFYIHIDNEKYSNNRQALRRMPGKTKHISYTFPKYKCNMI
jgi:hypothetical protein